MNEDNNKSYKSILKATGVFGMMQVSKMAITIVSSKFVAIYLGPVGLGLVALLNNVINIILAITNFEFLKTATREVALNSAPENNSQLNNSITTLQKMAVFIGFFGAVFSVVLSKYLSYYTFGTYDKQHWFVILSIYFLLTSFSNARLSLLQGLNKIKILAISNIIVTFLTAIGSILIYYFLRLDGIIWVVLYSSVILICVNFYFTREYSIKFYPIIFKDFYNESLPVFKLGFIMSLNLIFGQISYFILRLFLSNKGASNEILGFYEVSTVIMVHYLGLIFSAMAYDFYPKLSAISLDNSKVKNIVNNQIEIAIILVTPAIVLLYIIGPFLIEILYSKDFLNSFIILKIALFSVILKAVVFPLGYIILAKGNKKLYFKQALFGDLLNLGFSILFYHYFGLIGIGVSFVINYLVYGFYIYYLNKKYYDFSFTAECLKLIKINVFIGVLAIIFIYSFNEILMYVLLLSLLLISMFYSYSELNKRIDIKAFINKKFKRNK